MYYNITIKSNGSEYSLTSNNKEVTEREMDLYFASFIGASQEFISKIKKVEIKQHSDVKSINLIEKEAEQIIRPASIQETLKEEQTPCEIKQSQTVIQTQQVPTQAVQQQAPTSTVQNQYIQQQAPIQATPIQAMPTQTVGQQISNYNTHIQQAPTQAVQQPSITVAQNHFVQQQTPTQAVQQPSMTVAQNHFVQQQTPTQVIEQQIPNYNTLIQQMPTQATQHVLAQGAQQQTSFYNTSIKQAPTQAVQQQAPTQAVQQQAPTQAVQQQVPTQGIQEQLPTYTITTETIEIEQFLQQPATTQNSTEIDFNNHSNIIQAPLSQHSDTDLISDIPQQNESFAATSEISFEPTNEIYTKQNELFEIRFENNEYQFETYSQTPSIEEIPTKLNENHTEALNETTSNTFVQIESAYTNNAPILQNDIDELISLAQNKIDSLDDNLDFSLGLDFQANFTNQEQQTTIPAQQEIIQDIFTQNNQIQFDNNQQNINNDSQFLEINNTSTLLNKEEELNFLNTPTITEYDFTQSTVPTQLDNQIKQNFNYNAPSNTYNEFLNQQNNEINIPTINMQDVTVPTMQSSITNIGPKYSKEQYAQDFKLFLNQYKTSQTTDTFLICAYYIKHILNQETFTIKFINSKLFQSTGTIANMAIVDELINNKYITFTDSLESKKYCITPKGEEYFTSTFQG